LSSQRTPEDREQARLEREAKRATREGRPPPTAPEPMDVPPRDDPPPDPEPPPEPLEIQPEPTADPPGPDTQEWEPVFEAEPQAQRITPPSKPAPYETGAQPPITPRRSAPRLQDSPAAASRAQAASRLLHRRRQAGGDSPGTRRGRGRLALLAFGGLAVAVVVWLGVSLFQPFKGDGEASVRVMIPQGAGVGKIADILAEKDVISSAFFFEARATVSGRRGDLKPGVFELKKGMSHAAAMDVIAQGPPPDIVKVVIPEGRSRTEVKRIVGGGLKGDYLAAARRSSALNPRSYGAKRARNLEGFLFPATYELKRGKPVGALVDQQLVAFRRNFRGVSMRYAKRKNLTPYDILTIASMIDREAAVARERPLIASVIYNRLRDGIPLGIDATIRFATNNWTKPLTESQLATSSPYNTRARRGLPPGPIGSPGLASIRAAARPANTKFLYYVVKPGTCGRHQFSRTDAEFQSDVQRYNRARGRRGGKSPTNC
jgi:UPF0755 protein